MKFENRRDHQKVGEVRWEAGEGGRCSEVRTMWRSGAALNRREEREKARAIEGKKEGAH